MATLARLPQAYQGMGPAATQLHRAYLVARKAWKLAVREQWETYTRHVEGEVTECDLDAAIARARDAHAAMREAQRAAAHAPRGE